MIAYSESGGYGKCDIEEARKAVDKHLPPGSLDKITIMELIYDYEVLRRVINGGNFMYQHADGSEVRRIKLL